MKTYYERLSENWWYWIVFILIILVLVPLKLICMIPGVGKMIDRLICNDIYGENGIYGDKK